MAEIVVGAEVLLVKISAKKMVEFDDLYLDTMRRLLVPPYTGQRRYTVAVRRMKHSLHKKVLEVVSEHNVLIVGSTKPCLQLKATE